MRVLLDETCVLLIEALQEKLLGVTHVHWIEVYQNVVDVTISEK